MQKKDVIILALIVGISLFFIGSMIHNVFQITEDNLLPYKISAFIKLIGLGFLVSSMVIGGIVIDTIDRNLKLLLLILGLVLLVIYSIGSSQLEWNLTDSNSENVTEYSERPTGYGMPGFELGLLLSAIGVVFITRFKHKKHQ
jgi:glucan phosphoethanolaminetransferase (alkaline phosphatase superfamily)